jgi:AraC-like DNA-binding protein
MPSSSVRSFSDPDDYAAAIRQVKVSLTLTGRGDFAARLHRIDLHRLWMQRFSESLPRISRAEIFGERGVISFRTQAGPALSWGGTDLPPGAILRHTEGEIAYQRSSGVADIATMSLPLDDMASVGAALAGCDLTPPRGMLLVTPRADAMTKLRRLHAVVARLAETTPEVIAHSEVARGLEETLIETLVGCVADAPMCEDSAAQRRHQLIMRRFHRVVEQNADSALYIPEICAAIGVSARTLQTCCHEHLGMGPKRYLLLRRMHLAHRAFRKGAFVGSTVTQIAAEYGFWELGRFASLYKSLFSEKPSETLQNVRAASDSLT